eukprot:4842780-Pleurochrysis_carterae.AAC.1
MRPAFALPIASLKRELRLSASGAQAFPELTLYTVLSEESRQGKTAITSGVSAEEEYRRTLGARARAGSMLHACANTLSTESALSIQRRLHVHTQLRARARAYKHVRACTLAQMHAHARTFKRMHADARAHTRTHIRA